jgi:hypothetical protein
MATRTHLPPILNGGSVGTDGVTIADIEREGAAAFLWQIEQDLKANTYRPPPVLRVYCQGRKSQLYVGVNTAKPRALDGTPSRDRTHLYLPRALTRATLV